MGNRILIIAGVDFLYENIAIHLFLHLICIHYVCWKQMLFLSVPFFRVCICGTKSLRLRPPYLTVHKPRLLLTRHRWSELLNGHRYSKRSPPPIDSRGKTSTIFYNLSPPSPPPHAHHLLNDTIKVYLHSARYADEFGRQPHKSYGGRGFYDSDLEREILEGGGGGGGGEEMVAKDLGTGTVVYRANQ